MDLSQEARRILTKVANGEVPTDEEIVFIMEVIDPSYRARERKNGLTSPPIPEYFKRRYAEQSVSARQLSEFLVTTFADDWRFFDEHPNRKYRNRIDDDGFWITHRFDAPSGIECIGQILAIGMDEVA